MADYKEGDVSWQGFLRPYKDAEEAKAVLPEVHRGRQEGRRRGQDDSTAEGADEMVISTNIGLVDVVFRKGNTVAGTNGATAAPPAESLRPCAGQEPAGERPDDRESRSLLQESG